MIEFDPVLVHDWLTRSAHRHPDKTALICGRQRWRYQKLESHTNHLALALIEAGVKRGDRVVVLLDNSAETVIAMYAILKAAGVFVILAESLKGAKLGYILNNSGARVIITHVNKVPVINKALADAQGSYKVIWVGSPKNIPENIPQTHLSWDEIFSKGYDGTASYETQEDTKGKLPRGIDVDLAALIYTSGSTGQPKGVISTHHNIISAARSIIQYVENSEDDTILDVLPLSFDYGLYQVIMAFMFGGAVVLEKSFLYLHQTLERIAQEKITGFPIVPTVVALLLKLKDLSKYDFNTLRYLTNTGAALPVDHIRQLRKMLPQVKIISMFGLTECKRVSYLPPEDLDERPSSVGRAMPNCEVFIVDPDGNEVTPGEIGELIIKGSNVMQGYWKDPELTDRTYKNGAYPDDRILCSGDYFRRDERGFLYFMGRRDDMIKCKGEKVSAREVENVICMMETVAETAVVGVPDEILGQAVKAFIVPTPPAQLTEKQVLKFCAQNMETFMMPKYIEFVDSLPTTAHGKIDKKKLKPAEIE